MTGKTKEQITALQRDFNTLLAQLIPKLESGGYGKCEFTFTFQDGTIQHASLGIVDSVKYGKR